MHALDSLDALGRDLYALRAIGPTRARTAGELIRPGPSPNPRGWIYAGQDSLLFIADLPEPDAEPDADRDAAPIASPPLRASRRPEPCPRVLRLDYRQQRRARLVLQPFDPNAVIEFLDGTVLLGARRPMQAIHELCTGAEY